MPFDQMSRDNIDRHDHASGVRSVNIFAQYREIGMSRDDRLLPRYVITGVSHKAQPSLPRTR